MIAAENRRKNIPVTINFTRQADKNYVLQASLFVPRPLDEVFSFFADAANLDAITPPYLRFHITSPMPMRMEAGALIDYRLRLHGLPLRWRTRISVWEPPHRFVDEQVCGPYRRWVHEHRFVQRDGGTMCEDRVEYAIFCGWLMHPLFVQRDLRGIFEYRQRKLAERFSNDARFASAAVPATRRQ